LLRTLPVRPSKGGSVATATLLRTGGVRAESCCMLHRKGYDGMPLLSTFQLYLRCALPVLQVMLLPIRLGLTYIVGPWQEGVRRRASLTCLFTNCTQKFIVGESCRPSCYAAGWFYLFAVVPRSKVGRDYEVTICYSFIVTLQLWYVSALLL
jgi:hypothetical protein